MNRYLRMTWLVIRFAHRNRASLSDALELHALCTLALLRAESRTFNLCMGQVRGKVRRVHISRIAASPWRLPGGALPIA